MPQRLILLFAPVFLVAATILSFTGFAHTANATEAGSAGGSPGTMPGTSAGATSSSSDAQFTLEIRRLGVTVDRFRQRALLMRLDEAGPEGEVLLRDPKEYEWSSSTRWDQFTTRTNNIVSYTVLDWVQYWPIPTVLIGPPSDVSRPNAVQLGALLGEADNGSGVGNSFYIRVNDLNTADGSEVVGKLFKLFDEHPDLPAVFVMAFDGANTRGFSKTPGSPLPEFNKDGNFVPTEPDALVGLIVTRKDRVDQMMRPYATKTENILDKSKTQYDVVKLSNYYWKEQRAYPNPARGVYDPTFEYWQSKLPEFYKTEALSFPKGFKPNPWVPVPWTTWQLDEFDQWPVLGYLHRPVTVDLSDGHGAPAKKADKIEKLRNGWEQALATLPQGNQPARMFYDTGASTANLALLVQLLHDNKQKIDLDDPADAFDMQHRIGADTGVSSTFVQIALATMIGYGDGKTNALVNLREPGHATITMLSPPDEASRKAHPQVFSWSVPQ
jgi:hypothetical protein